MDKLEGYLTPVGTIEGSLSDSGSLVGWLTIPQGAAPPTYDGEYTVTPVLWADITLETAQKMMARDLTVKEIPVTQTSNPYGGKTVVIG